MPRVPYPLPRGGRGPQIGPGTFDGRSSDDPTRPDTIDHIVWSRGDSTPDVEIWCFLTTALSGPVYRKIQNGSHAWIDQVPQPEGFVPPTTTPPMGNETELALKQYAVDRMLSVFDRETGPGDWKVRVARPYPAGPLGANGVRRFTAGTYAVQEVALGTIPKAWVWVTADGMREVWALHRPGLPGGFAYPGTTLPISGLPFPGTELIYANVQINGLVYPDIGKSITDFRAAIVGLQGSPVADPEDLEIHDYRIGPDV